LRPDAFDPHCAATGLILHPQRPASSSIGAQCTRSHATLLRTSCGHTIPLLGHPSRFTPPPAFFARYPLSFNPVTNDSRNQFLIRNSTNITSAAPILQNSLSPLTYWEDVFLSLLPPPSSLRIGSALPSRPSDPSPSSPLSSRHLFSLALLCGSLLSSPHCISSTPCLSRHRQPLIVCSRAPTVFPGVVQSAHGLPLSSTASYTLLAGSPCLTRLLIAPLTHSHSCQPTPAH